MAIIGSIIIGFLVGIIAKLLMPGRDPGGFIITIVLGIAGSIVANHLGRLIGLYRTDESAGFIASILGAMLILWLYRLISRRVRSHG